MIDAICREIEIGPLFHNNESISSIYFGGGTPSIISTGQLRKILSRINERFHVDKDAEVTLEANPDDLSSIALAEWVSLGFNRLSIGIQSFNEAELRWMNRAHHAAQSVSALELVKASRISNFSVDLIYGSNLQPDKQLLMNLEMIKQFEVPHISCYGLTVEPKTALQHHISSGKEQPPDEHTQAVQFLFIMNWMRDHGYEHYEVSNYALPGMRSRHNSSYWNGGSYYGFGPSAHAFNGQRTRSWNVANNTLYMKQIEMGMLPSEKEELSNTQQMNEYIMTGLRTIEGINLDKIAQRWGLTHSNRIKTQCRVFLEKGKLRKSGSHLMLTDEGMLMADGIASDLFIV